MAQIEYDILNRHDTAADWAANNTVLMVAEKGFETDTKRYKVGDGSTAWNSLGYDILTLADKGVANGVAPLNALNKIDAGYIAQVAVASTTAFTPAGNIAATDVQAAIQELDTEKAAKNGETITNATLTGVNHITFDTTPSVPAYAAGNMYWDANNQTVAIQMGTDNTTLQIGQESYIYCTNNTGLTIANGKAVYISGASGNRPTIALAKADLMGTADAVIGVTTQEILDGATGFVTTFGLVNDIDTSAFAPGTAVYLSATTAGAMVSTQPASPNYVAHLGHVIIQNALTGSIYVTVDVITQTANSVRISSGAGVAEMNNVQDFFRHSWSSGVTEGCAITDNGNGTVNIAAGEVLLRETAADDAVLTPLVVQAQNNIAITANDVSYLYVNYNAGSPVWQVGSTLSDFDGLTKVVGYVVGRNGLILNIVDVRKINVDSARKNRRQKVESDGYSYSGWWRSSLARSTLSASGLNPLVSSGKYFYFDNPITHTGFDTTIAGTATANVFKYFYNRTGSWTQIADQKTINSTQYDLAGVLTAMGVSKYRTDWVYVVMCNTTPYLAIVLGNDEYGTIAAAQAAPAPSVLPPQFDGIGILVGQINILKSAVTVTVQLAGAASFSSGGSPADHNNLANIQGGAVTEYYHLTSAEYTGTGTGVHARQTAPTLKGTIGLDVATDFKVDKAGVKTFGWRDNVSPFMTKGTGSNNPSWALFRNGIYGYFFSASVMQEVWLNFHIDHDYAAGTVLYPHVHWAPNTTSIGTVRWGLEYTVAKGHQQGAASSYPATTTVYVEQVIAANSQYQHFVTEVSIGNAIPATNVEPDTIILCRFFRDAAHVNDTFPDTVMGIMGDLHYQAGTFFTLNKAPTFYI